MIHVKCLSLGLSLGQLLFSAHVHEDVWVGTEPCLDIVELQNVLEIEGVEA